MSKTHNNIYRKKKNVDYHILKKKMFVLPPDAHQIVFKIWLDYVIIRI